MANNRRKKLIEDVRRYGFRYLFWKVMHRMGLASRDRVSHCVENYYLDLSPEIREQELKKWFLDQVGYPLNLDNPRTLDEKIQWLKLYDSTPKKTKLADKYQVREWISEKIGEQYLIPLLGVWNSFDEIDFNSLPNQYVLKANHGSGMNLIVKDSKKLDLKKVRKEVNIWLNTNFGVGPSQEWHYLHTPHKVLAEQYVGSLDEAPDDYKVYCFNGVPTYIQVIEGRFIYPRQLFLNNAWEPMDFYYTHYGRMESVPERPIQLDRMLKLSEKLAQGFALVRIDWYLTDDEEIYFGEMTFTPAQGTQRWIPPETDKMLGDMVILPQDKYIAR